jgi:aminopeptidase N
MLYLESARRGLEAPLMRPGDEFPERLYSLNYNKTAQVLAALRSIVGEEAFHEALREYGRRWRGRHPYPYDFFNTFADVTGRDLGWFWRTWFEETWPLDQAIADVRADGDSLSIVVEDRGLAPMPVRIAVTRDDGTVERVEVPVDTWLTGARTTTVPVPRAPEAVRVEIDPEAAFPDIDRSNQVWTAR